MSYEKLNEKILEMKDEMFDTIRENVAICSVKGEPEEDAPYGREVKRALDHLLSVGEKMGFKTGNVDNRVGWIEYGEGEEMVGVLGHVDVVPLGEGWIMIRLDVRSMTVKCTAVAFRMIKDLQSALCMH